MKRIILCFSAMLLLGFSLNAQEMGLKENKEFTDLGDYVRQAEFSPFRNYFFG
jgi:hypothetical protein